jgi:hypothetical protein
MDEKMDCRKLIHRIVITLIVSFNARAFNVTDDFKNGAYWHNFPIQMYKFATSSIEDPLLKTLVDQAKLAWEAVVGREIWEIPEEYFFTNPGNTIRWSYNFSQETGFSDQTTLAITIRYSVGSSFEKVEIILNGNNAFLRNNHQNMLYQTILHELGHVVGLGHSEYSNAVMAANLSGVNNLHQDDIEGMNYLTDETLSRQVNGFGSSELQSFEDDGQSSVAACGSIDLNSSNGGGGGFSFLLTLFLGYLSTILVRRPQVKFSFNN